MDTLSLYSFQIRKLYYLFVFILFLIPSISKAGILNVLPPTEVITYSNGQIGLSYRGQKPVLTYPDLERPKVTIDQPARVNTSKGSQLVPLKRNFRVPANAVSKGVKTVAKSLPFIATAAAIYEILCDTNLICADPESGELSKKTLAGGDPDYPAQTDQYKFQSGTFTGYPTAALAALAAWKSNAFHCSAPKVCTVGNPVVLSATLTRFTVYSNGGMQGTVNSTQVAGCANNYTLSGIYCNYDLASETYTPLTETDFTEIENTTYPDSIITDLIDNEVPLELNQPESEPFTRSLGSSTETIRDNTGTATGTKTTETTVTGTPETENPDGSVTYNINETSTITNTDITNSNTTTTTIENEIPQDQPEDQDIKFDQVDDTDLPTFNLDTPFEQQNWGTGAGCPANPTVVTSKGTLELPFNVACDYAVMIKPIFLILCGLFSAYIIAGAIKS
jgi:hypothetical protein